MEVDKTNLLWALGPHDVPFFLEKEGFVLEGKENVSGKPSCGEQSGLICEYLASNHGPTVSRV